MEMQSKSEISHRELRRMEMQSKSEINSLYHSDDECYIKLFIACIVNKNTSDCMQRHPQWGKNNRHIIIHCAYTKTT